MTKQYRYFSADSHFECPPDMWTHRVPKAHRERAPAPGQVADGGSTFIVEEGETHHLPRNQPVCREIH